MRRLYDSYSARYDGRRFVTIPSSERLEGEEVELLDLSQKPRKISRSSITRLPDLSATNSTKLQSHRMSKRKAKSDKNVKSAKFKFPPALKLPKGVKPRPRPGSIKTGGDTVQDQIEHVEAGAGKLDQRICDTAATFPPTPPATPGRQDDEHRAHHAASTSHNASTSKLANKERGRLTPSQRTALKNVIASSFDTVTFASQHDLKVDAVRAAFASLIDEPLQGPQIARPLRLAIESGRSLERTWAAGTAFELKGALAYVKPGQVHIITSATLSDEGGEVAVPERVLSEADFTYLEQCMAPGDMGMLKQNPQRREKITYHY